MLIVPAEACHLTSLLREGQRVTLARGLYGCLLGQIAVSEAYSVFETASAAAPCVVAGVVFPPDRAAECWFVAAPGGLSAACLLGAVRVFRAGLIRRAAETSAGIECFVRPENVAGRRLARLLGFRPNEIFMRGHQQWVLRHG